MPIFLAFSLQNANDRQNIHAYYSAYKRYIADRFPDLSHSMYDEAIRIFCDTWGY